MSYSPRHRKPRRQKSTQRSVPQPRRDDRVRYYVAGSICLVAIDGHIVTCLPARWVR